jgi:hypothetical protein
MSLFRHNDYVKWMSSYVTDSLNQARSESALAATIYFIFGNQMSHRVTYIIICVMM